MDIGDYISIKISHHGGYLLPALTRDKGAVEIQVKLIGKSNYNYVFLCENTRYPFTVPLDKKLISLAGLNIDYKRYFSKKVFLIQINTFHNNYNY